jgi:hypothetical protein
MELFSALPSPLSPVSPSPSPSPPPVVSAVQTLLDVGADATPGKVELAEDCSADPWAPSCHRPSLMDMINGVGHRAQVRTRHPQPLQTPKPVCPLHLECLAATG